ncbi:MAG: hypothetical protein HFE51_05035 [Clostridia bacterium]|nr:hypothetical protein [Clostridia bacterium]
MVIDRTQADVEAAKMLLAKVQSGQMLTTAEKVAIERGTCTITMLNRVESKQKELAELLNEHYYMVSIVNKINWRYKDIFTYQDHKRLLSNLDKLQQAFFVYTNTPQTPTYLYNYLNANNIEKILVDVESMLDDMINRFRECNTFYCGEVNNL